MFLVTYEEKLRSTGWKTEKSAGNFIIRHPNAFKAFPMKNPATSSFNDPHARSKFLPVAVMVRNKGRLWKAVLFPALHSDGRFGSTFFPFSE